MSKTPVQRADEIVDDWQPKDGRESLRDRIALTIESAIKDAIAAQLPDGMEHCTILFKECAKGHGWLTATNWVQHGCPTCAVQAEREACARTCRQVALRRLQQCDTDGAASADECNRAILARQPRPA